MENIKQDDISENISLINIYSLSDAINHSVKSPLNSKNKIVKKENKSTKGIKPRNQSFILEKISQLGGDNNIHNFEIDIEEEIVNNKTKNPSTFLKIEAAKFLNNEEDLIDSSMENEDKKKMKFSKSQENCLHYLSK